MSKKTEEHDLRGDVVVEVSKDKMTATLTLRSVFTEDQPPQEEDILAALRSGGIRRGISRSALIEVLRNPVFDQPIIIARGHPPVQGEDSRVEFNVNIARKDAAPHCLATGRVDFKNLDLIETVKKGTVIGMKQSPTPGHAGYNVYGEEISPKPGRDRPLKTGRNVEISPDGKQMIAAVDGAVNVVGDRVSITPLVEINGDVDYSVGNINFPGSVNIRGSVLAGFSVRSDGDINVNGTVEAATLECTGTLTIKGGVVGQGRASLTAGGDIVARFISEANVTAGGNVVTDGPILHSQVRAGNRIMASGRKGVIAGGRLVAEEGITAVALGSSMGTRTEVIIEVEEEIQNQLRDVTSRLTEYQKTLEKAREAYSQMTGGSTQPLTAEQRVALDPLQQSITTLENEIAALHEEHMTLHEKVEKARMAMVKISSETYPGVVISIAGAYLTVNDTLKALSFARDKGEIVTKSTF